MKSVLRAALVILVLFAIALNLTLDVFSYEQTKVTAATRVWVQKSYQIIQQVDSLAIDYNGLIFLLQKKPATSPEVIECLTKLQDSSDHLASMLSNDSQQIQSIKPLQRILASPPEPKNALPQFLEGLPFIRQVRQREVSLLEKHIVADEKEAQTTQLDLKWGLFADTILLFSLFFILVMEFKRRVGTESLLEQTIAEMKEAIHGLENLDAKKNDLIKATVHDLKNPLGAIKGFADLINDEAENATSVMEMSAVIQRISEKTLTLVNSLLQPSALALGHSVPHKGIFDVIQCLSEVTVELGSQVKSKNQTLDLALPIHPVRAVGDSEKINDLFLNIIGNAVKFSPPGERIHVRARVKGGVIQIEVEDHGPGFTTEDKKKAFVRYQKLSAQPTGSETSTGLGLALAKEVAELHHGQIKILDSRSGRGAIFLIELPILPLTEPDLKPELMP